MAVGPPLEQVECGSDGFSHMDHLTNPNTPYHIAGPKDMTTRRKTAKDMKQTLLSASMCQKMCLVVGTR